MGRTPSIRPILLNGVLITAVLAAAAASPPATGPVTVFAAPWSMGAAEIAARAGGRLLASGRWPWSIVAVSEDGDFVRRLYAAGAMLVTQPQPSIGCRALLEGQSAQ